jgi:excisionase family DNA binding protein
MNGWARPKEAAKYCGVSERTFREWFKMGLSFSKIRGTVLVRYEHIDDFLEHFSTNSNRTEQIVEECLKGLK